MTVSRGWTWIDENADTNAEPCADCKPVAYGPALPDDWECDACAALQDAATDLISVECDDLMMRWNALMSEIDNENLSRRSRYDRDDDRDDYEPDDIDPAELAKIESRKRIREELRQKEIESIEEMLADRNARPMRAYEHWNEDEAYMKWAERDRDDDY